MAIRFHPKPGTVLICDFTGYKEPEIVKERPVVVISPRRRRVNHLVTVVPLSTTKPNPVEDYHHLLDPESLPGRLSKKKTWAKCDIVATVSFERLDRVKVGRDKRTGKRQFVTKAVNPNDFNGIQEAVLAGLGLKSLTKRL